METYIIRINGEEYEVEVEKKDTAAAPSAARTQTAAPKAAKKAGAAGKPAEAGEPVICGTSGAVFKIVSREGQEVRQGDTVIVLEAMKMEIPVVAPKDGTVSSILVSEGENTSAGQTVAYIV